MKLIIHPVDLNLKHTFTIAHDSRDIQRTLVVELKGDNHSGFGEATASKYYNNSIEEMIAVLEENRTLIESYNFEEPELFWVRLKKYFSHNSFILSALDVAVHDLYAKSRNISLHELWGLEHSNYPTSNYTIGIDTIEKMGEKLTEFPWLVYKIKLGTSDDLKIIKELRKLTDATFRVDANCGWEVGEALRNAMEMKSLGVEFIEQPLAAGNWEGMKVLFENSPLPLIADESLIGEDGVEQCVGYFHGINIKLMKCGGFTPARRMIRNAKSLGMKVMVGCMTESSVGIAAVGQLLGEVDYIDMDGHLLVMNDVAEGPKFRDGKVVLPRGNGIGIEHLII